MNLLIDTHALIWAVDLPEKLSESATHALQDPVNVLWISSGTVWEIAIKVGLEKLKLSHPVRSWLQLSLTGLQAQLLPITISHAALQAGLPFHHRDPFDRLIAAQALHEYYGIISSDVILDRYGVNRIW